MTRPVLSLREQLVDVVRRVPAYLLGAPDRWLIRNHAPVWPKHQPWVCQICRVAWPCVPYMDARKRQGHPGWSPDLYAPAGSSELSSS